MPSFSILPLAPKGLGFGNPNAAISVTKRLQTGSLTRDIVQTGTHVLLAGEHLVDTVHQDSGCIDGRPATQVTFRGTDNQLHTQAYTHNTEHLRPLVAGGGYITARVGLTAIYGVGRTALDDLQQAIETLTERHIFAGAHTGSQINIRQGLTDCGANDNFAAIVAMAIAEQDAIKVALQTFGEITNWLGDDFETAFEKAMAQFQQMADPAYTKNITGSQNLELIKQNLSVDENGQPRAVIKHQQDEHKEALIFLNAIPNTTLDQAGFASTMKRLFADRQSSELIQAFVVDVWYIKLLARALGRTTAQQDLAFVAMLIYQLAAAATLTDGSLPVFMAKENL